jgi:hypothetical protein
MPGATAAAAKSVAAAAAATAKSAATAVAATAASTSAEASAAVTGGVAKWGSRLAAAGAPSCAVGAFSSLRHAVALHQSLLRDEGIGVEVDERDRVRVNARRVGLEAPSFADELDFALGKGRPLGELVTGAGGAEVSVKERDAAIDEARVTAVKATRQ